jgi:hypothetical protein
MDYGDAVQIRGLGAVTVNAVLEDGSFTVTDADGSVQGPYTEADVERAAPEAP